MLQHLLLLLVVPPLLLLGLPSMARRRPPRVPPSVAWTAGIGAMYVWHAPLLYDAALRAAPLHVVQHLTFLATGVLFWWPIAGPMRERRLGPGTRAVYLLGACLASAVLGIVIALAPVGTYAAYAEPEDLLGVLPLLRNGWHVSAAIDQSVGGLLMWVGGGLVYGMVLLSGVARWLDAPR
jgi:cytochrome c oxidase assembly factor CtaG